MRESGHEDKHWSTHEHREMAVIPGNESETRVVVTARAGPESTHEDNHWSSAVPPRREARWGTTAMLAVTTGTKVENGLLEAAEKAHGSHMGQQVSESGAQWALPIASFILSFHEPWTSTFASSWVHDFFKVSPA